MLHKDVEEGHTFMGGCHVGGVVGCRMYSAFMVFWVYYWGCARGFGRGTLYMKWGQQNQRFGTMRLRGEKDEDKRKEDPFTPLTQFSPPLFLKIFLNTTFE